MAAVATPRVLSPGEIFLEPEVQKEEAWSQDLNIKLVCPDCRLDPPNLREEFAAGDTICADCGLVLSDRVVDTRSEWRTFANDDQGNDDPSRVGDAANPLLNGSQLQTNIAFGDGGTRNRELHRAQNKSSHDKTTAHLLSAYKEIQSFCEGDRLSLNHAVSEAAKHLFKIVEDQKVLRGKNERAIIASCIFIACRQHSISRSFKEIQAATKVSKKEIGRTFKQLESYFQKASKDRGESNPLATNPMSNQTQAGDISSMLERFCQNLNLPTKATAVCIELASKMKTVLAGRSPLTIAGAAIYVVSNILGFKKSPKDIGEACGVSDGTIRTAYKSIYGERAKFMDDEWVKAKGGDISKLPPV